MTRRRLALAVVCTLAAIANIQALGNRFAMDDRFIVLHNDRIHELDSFADALTMPYWPHTVGRNAMYRPATSGALALQWLAWQDRPLGYHAVNLALHIVVTAMVFLLLAGLMSGVAGPAFGGALFAVHPVHVEAVAGVVGLGEILAAAFALAACLVYLRDGRGFRSALAIGVLYLLSLLSKEIGATLPGLLVLVEAVRPGRARAGEKGEASQGAGTAAARGLTARVLERWPVYAATMAALAVYVVLRAVALGTVVGSAEAAFFRPLDGVDQFLTAVSIWPEYVRLMLFPVHLVADYSPGVLMPVTSFDARVVMGLLTGALTVLAAVWLRPRVPEATVGILWFALAVLPVSNLLIPIGVLLAERTLYLPSVGLSLVAAGVLAWAYRCRPEWRRGLAAAAVILVTLAGARTWLRTPDWRDTTTIIETLTRDHPESFRSQWARATWLYSRGRTQEAMALFRSAARLLPGHYQLQVEYGHAALGVGAADEAAESFRAARDAIPELAEGHVLLMAALLEAGRPDQAAAAGLDALELHPDHRGIHHQLSIALARSGDLPGALDARQRSIRLGGERAAWSQFLHAAELLVRLDRPGEASAALDSARVRAPGTAAVPTLPALRAAVESADSTVLPYP